MQATKDETADERRLHSGCKFCGAPNFQYRSPLRRSSALATSRCPRRRVSRRNAGKFRVYAAAIYEILGYIAGHGLLNGPLFDVAPCPTTIFTIGVMLLARGFPLLLWLSVIPVLWTLVGTSAALFLGVREDAGLAVAAGVLVISVAVRRSQNA